MFTVPVHTCSVLLDFYDFQSFTILCELETLHSSLFLLFLSSSCVFIFSLHSDFTFECAHLHRAFCAFLIWQSEIPLSILGITQ